MRFNPGLHGLPLLARELIVLSSRRQTWVIRSLFAIGLYTVFLIFLGNQINDAGDDQMRMLGRGFYIFAVTGIVQLFGVSLFLPAMMAGSIAAEKERDTLQLLLVTGLSPSTILFEKLCSGLLPMLTFLLLGVPLLPVSFAYGGVSVDHLVALLYLLLLICLQVGTISLACSAFCRTTTSALLCSYVLISVLYGFSLTWQSHLNPFILYVNHIDRGQPERLSSLVLTSQPSWIIVVVSYGLALYWLKRRAQQPQRNMVLRLFGRIDQAMTWMNRITGGVTLVKDSDRLLTEQPVAWRETTKQSLGRARYMFRTSLLLGICALLIGIGVFKTGRELIVPVTLALWALIVVVVVISSINTIARERMRQTLDLLLTTPMTGASIVAQKMRGIWRVVLLLGGFLMALSLLEGWMRVFEYRYSPWSRYREAASVEGLLLYGAVSAAAIVIYLYTVAWVGCWFSLRVRDRTRAMAWALGTIGAAWGLPPLLLSATAATSCIPWNVSALLSWVISPAALLVFNEQWFDELLEQGLPILILSHFLTYAGLGLFLSVVCRRNADKLLGRSTWERRARHDRTDEYESWSLAEVEPTGSDDRGS